MATLIYIYICVCKVHQALGLIISCACANVAESAIYLGGDFFFCMGEKSKVEN